MKPLSPISRRLFSHTMLHGLLSYGLLDALLLPGWTHEQPESLRHWTIRLHEMCNDLRQDHLSPQQWQAEVESFLGQVSLHELLEHIDFDRLTSGFQFPDLGVGTRRIQLPKLGGLPARLAFYPKLFGLQKGRAIIPHGHKNMASAHLVLAGEFALRQYDKLQDEGEHLIIRPAIDTTLGAGQASSISDDHHNIHWFRTLSPTAFTFDVIVLDLNGQPYEIDNLDPHTAEQLGDGSLRVKKLAVQEALEKYGKEE